MICAPTRRNFLGGAASLAASRAIGATPPATLFISHPAALEHDPGATHPDRAERLRAIFAALDAPRFATLARREGPLATRDTLLRVHGEEMIARIEKTSPHDGHARLDGDTTMSPGSLAAAMRAAGGAVAAVDAVMRREATNAFVATRPPGHHARESAAMGFCIFNNAAIAAKHARAAHGAQRIAIVDFDAHHGNGVQEIFWNDKDTLYCSTHQMPLYPGAGAITETGAHDNIVNAPLRKGDGGDVFREALATRILPRVEAFAPDVIILCAGFDAHLHDPLAGLRFVDDDYRDVTLRTMEIAARRCNGRIVSLLEGGYTPKDLGQSVAAHVAALIDA